MIEPTGPTVDSVCLRANRLAALVACRRANSSLGQNCWPQDQYKPAYSSIGSRGGVSLAVAPAPLAPGLLLRTRSGRHGKQSVALRSKSDCLWVLHRLPPTIDRRDLEGNGIVCPRMPRARTRALLERFARVAPAIASPKGPLTPPTNRRQKDEPISPARPLASAHSPP